MVTRSGGAVLLALAVSGGALGWLIAIGGPAELPRYGAIGPLVSLLAHALVATTPASDFIPFGLANGAVFGVLLGGLLNWGSWVAGSAFQWRLAREAADHHAVAARLDALPDWLRSLPVGHPLLLIFGRWVPLGGFTVSVAAGLGGVSLSRLLTCAALGSAPPAFVVSAAGAGAFELVSQLWISA